MKIDAHHHFWQYDPAEYGWIDDSMASLRRDFLPADLEVELQAAEIDGVVSVQARQTLAETRWLMDLAKEHSFIKGVVGWVPLAEADIRDMLRSLTAEPSLKGVRHVVHDEPDDDFILGEAFSAGVAVLKDYKLTYDILIFERHLPQAIQFVDRHPQQVFVLDHIAKPQIRHAMVELWGQHLRQLAERENVYCKVSGLVTEADWHSWTEPQLTVYLETVLEAFSPERLMFGSDWPVCLLATTYGSWYELAQRFFTSLSSTEQDRVFGRTAIDAYQL